MAHRVKSASMTAIYGRRGSGKSTRAKALIKDERRLIVFDPTTEWAREVRGLKRVSDLGALHKELLRGWGRGFRISYEPPGGREAEALHHLCQLLFRAQETYRAEADERQLMLVVEEIQLAFPVTALPPAIGAMNKMCQAGRHYGVNVIGITQRPATISMNFRSNVDRVFCFPLTAAKDRRAAAEYMGGERAIESRLASLADHNYLEWSQSGIVEGRNTLKK